MKQVVWGCVAVGVWMCGIHAMAQERIYRCGNEYTNNPNVSKQAGCRLVEGGHVTVIQAPARPTVAPTVSGASNTATRPASAAGQVSKDQQQARDKDARAILQAELVKAQEKLNRLKAEYNDGHPTKSALELRNTQAFVERLEALKADVARQESDVAGIQRELSRLPGS